VRPGSAPTAAAAARCRSARCGRPTYVIHGGDAFTSCEIAAVRTRRAHASDF
jgi:hypothetical protein